VGKTIYISHFENVLGKLLLDVLVVAYRLKTDLNVSRKQT